MRYEAGDGTPATPTQKLCRPAPRAHLTVHVVAGLLQEFSAENSPRSLSRGIEDFLSHPGAAQAQGLRLSLAPDTYMHTKYVRNWVSTLKLSANGNGELPRPYYCICALCKLHCCKPPKLRNAIKRRVKRRSRGHLCLNRSAILHQCHQRIGRCG